MPRHDPSWAGGQGHLPVFPDKMIPSCDNAAEVEVRLIQAYDRKMQGILKQRGAVGYRVPVNVVADSGVVEDPVRQVMRNVFVEKNHPFIQRKKIDFLDILFKVVDTRIMFLIRSLLPARPYYPGTKRPTDIPP